MECASGLQAVECDPAGVHQFFQRLPEPFPVEAVLERGLAMFARLPPGRLLAGPQGATVCVRLAAGPRTHAYLHIHMHMHMQLLLGLFLCALHRTFSKERVS